MKFLTALQNVTLFAAWPFLIGWLSQAQFPGASAAFVGAIIVYCIAYAMMVATVWNVMERD